MPKKPTIAPRKPTRSPDPALAQKFLDAAEAKEEPKIAEVRQLRGEPETKPSLAPAPSAKQPGRRIYERKRDGRKVRQTTVYLDPALAKKLAYHCIDVEQDQSTIINEALKAYLA